MTRKQYRKKVRQLQRNIARYAKETGGQRITNADRVNIPLWGSVIVGGKYEGQILRSYQQCWDMMVEVMGKTDFMAGLTP